MSALQLKTDARHERTGSCHTGYTIWRNAEGIERNAMLFVSRSRR